MTHALSMLPNGISARDDVEESRVSSQRVWSLKFAPRSPSIKINRSREPTDLGITKFHRVNFICGGSHKWYGNIIYEPFRPRVSGCWRIMINKYYNSGAYWTVSNDVKRENPAESINIHVYVKRKIYTNNYLTFFYFMEIHYKSAIFLFFYFYSTAF